MSTKRAKLEERLREMRALKDRQRNALEQIQTLLGKADIKRNSVRDNQRHWNHVLNNLETSLDEAKSRFNVSEQEIVQMRKRLERVRDGGPDDTLDDLPDLTDELSPADASSILSPQDLASLEDPALAAAHIVETPLEDLADLPLQEVALGKSHLEEKSQDEGKEKLDLKRLAGRLELYRNTRPPAAQEISSFNNELDLRRQRLLRTATEKIIARKIESMTLEEVKVVKNCYDLMTNRLVLDPAGERLKNILENSMAELGARIAELNIVWKK